MIALAAAAVLGFYLLAVPVKFAVLFESGLGVSLGVGAFEARFALRAAKKPKKLHKKPKKKQKKRGIDDLFALIPGVKYLLRHTDLEMLRLSGRISTSDAAATALICGCATAFFCALKAAIGGNIADTARPDFSGGKTQIRLIGIVSVRAGHIILAALIAGSRRFLKWKNTRLRAL